MADTTARALRLLALLQSRVVWTSEELSRRLGVTPRSVRRDVERLRSLGYPVEAERGAGGGYRLGAGKALPPLLLDAEEGAAVVLALRSAADGAVVPTEAVLRTLAKLDQVLPPAVRQEVAALQQATVTVPRGSAAVDSASLMLLSRAIRDRVQVRFAYTGRDGAASERRVEPYQVVSLTSHRWYLMAWDLERDDWRSFRVDRMTDLHASTFTFPLREAPDAAEYVRDSVVRSPYAVVMTARVALPASRLRELVPPNGGQVTPLDDSTSLLVTGANSVAAAVHEVAWLGAGVEVLDPPEVRDAVRALARQWLASHGEADDPT